ncbi:hypothetical protein [Selenomonas ruminantium]|jgi:hypothetical protein|uniref:hypothetical protein n=1 Tax=Selenomonas ruminantium TaxID=971 RepID=UPI0026EA4475|nr:hypothetical protein [Selenomonas ruminantium]
MRRSPRRGFQRSAQYFSLASQPAATRCGQKASTCAKHLRVYNLIGSFDKGGTARLLVEKRIDNLSKGKALLE